MTRKFLSTLSFIAIASSLSLSVACKKKSEDSGQGANQVEKEFDESEVPAAERKPVPGVNLDELGKSEANRFNALIDKLPSPCGNAHSLRTSRNVDTTCKRASFAVEYVYELIKDEMADADVREFYGLRFRDAEKTQLSVDGSTPHSGPTDASVNVVEFYDYGCPACANFKSVIETSLLDFENDVVVYYKQFPLPGHTDSPGAAQAALAANKQGKFKEMHDLLFANQHSHKMADLKGYAGQIGLDVAQWEKDFPEFSDKVVGDRSEGKKAKVTSTPVIFIDGLRYEGPAHPKYFTMWIEEALAGAI